MEEHGWVLTLPKGADKLHEAESGVSREEARLKKERISSKADKRIYQDTEEKGPRMKKANVERGLLRSRPMLRDVINNFSE